MTVHGCVDCPQAGRITFIAGIPGKQFQCDDLIASAWFGCSVCGSLYCVPCAENRQQVCACGTPLIADRMFEPTGDYRLPPGIRQHESQEARFDAVEQLWTDGMIVKGEYDYYRTVIQGCK